MALVKGTNCGFVMVAPVADPLDLTVTVDDIARGLRDIAPVGSVRVTEIGWWCDNDTEESDFDVAIYSHDAVNDRPDVFVGSALNNAKGLASGWKVVSGLNIPVTPGITYWLAMQLDNTPTTTRSNYKTNGAGEKQDYQAPETSLNSPWGVSDGTVDRLIAFYAVVEIMPAAQTVLEYERKTRGVNRGVCRGAA